ncbi:MAG: AraC family transcriptional regulator [Bacteroidia bacterium]
MHLPHDYRKGKSLQTLVENKTTFTLNKAELNLFETHKQAEQVTLTFHEPVIASMIMGKKRMHLRENDPFPFLPGESILMEADDPMCIDFPEATMHNPTKCLAMTFSEDLMGDVLGMMNEDRARVDHDDWHFFVPDFHFMRSPAIQQIIQRMIFLFTENHPSKDLFVDMMLKELLVRILQSESRGQLLQLAGGPSSHSRLAFIVHYIREHIHEKLSVKSLSNKACMSESNFYRAFKNELGQSPVDFINEERLSMAAGLLTDPNNQVQDVSLMCGFNSLSYFTRLFKRKYGCSPGAYQQKMQQGIFMA